MSDDVSQGRASGSARGFQAPPDGFDPLAASAAELAQHGLPRRPDREREPFLAARWAKTFGQPLSIVRADLAIEPIAPPRPSAPPDFSVDGWAGVARRMLRPRFEDPEFGGASAAADPYVRPATFISAEWVVPRLMGDPGDFDAYISIWVGLDGFPRADEDLEYSATPQQILRAGVQASSNSSGTEFEWVGWIEWYTTELGGTRASVENFPVQSGDRVAVVVCVPEPKSAAVFFANLSRDHGTSVPLDAPAPRLRSAGVTAQWIVEGYDPSISLPFSPVTFESCVAGSSDEVFHLTPDAVETNMFKLDGIGEPGPDVTTTRIASPTTAEVEWIGAPA
jgi:hypothetical protein